MNIDSYDILYVDQYKVCIDPQNKAGSFNTTRLHKSKFHIDHMKSDPSIHAAFALPGPHIKILIQLGSLPGKFDFIPVFLKSLSTGLHGNRFAFLILNHHEVSIIPKSTGTGKLRADTRLAPGC